MAKSIAINLKIRAINEYFDPEGDGLYAIAKRYGVSHVSVLNWVHDKDKLFRQCKENVLALAEFGDDVFKKEAHTLTLEKESPSFPLSTTYVDENKYLKNRVAYLEALLEVNDIDIRSVSKKKPSQQLNKLQKKEGTTVSMLCKMAGVSRKCYYQYLEYSRREDPYSEARARIVVIQNAFDYVVGYRHMTAKLRNENIVVNHKKVLALMKEENCLSKVRRRLHSKGYYRKRKEEKENKPPNILPPGVFLFYP
ncbi:MAG: transposase [Bacteroidetes bacterium]|nr:transposase [Bacteroidota bacterium]